MNWEVRLNLRLQSQVVGPGRLLPVVKYCYDQTDYNNATYTWYDDLCYVMMSLTR